MTSRFTTVFVGSTIPIFVSGFAPIHDPNRVQRTLAPLGYSRLDLVEKEFQLEEREDQDSAMTQLLLNADGSVNVGITNGPPVEGYKGSWSVKEDLKGDAQGENAFHMTLVRTYEAGAHTGTNQAGNFDFQVQRDFYGDIEETGQVVSISGTIHGRDAAANVDCEVGYFSLIDEATEVV